MKMKINDNTRDEGKDTQAIEHGRKVTIEAKTRAEAVERLKELRKQAADKGLDAVGGFIVYDYEKEDIGGAPFSATVTFIDPKNI
jgi:HJR/Mrr/RecB family endonuclease